MQVNDWQTKKTEKEEQTSQLKKEEEIKKLE